VSPFVDKQKCACTNDHLAARLLRYLAVHHIFREVSPDVFANNRLSSVLDTGKSVEEIMQKYVRSKCCYTHLQTEALTYSQSATEA
jgi:hypothetical protein